MEENLKEMYKDLEKVFGTKAVDKIHSHIYSLAMKIEDLIKSRDNWKRKYLRIKDKK